ncbi:MAG: hypothetical protein IKG81_11385 [Bacteroidales bacterium]|nr:hypothetical protein [Bacteroidales bacterium]
MENSNTKLSKGKNQYKWQYCSLGGTKRVCITRGEDIAHLAELDQKLWTVLSCPVKGLELDERTLDLIDYDRDGKIRADEVITAANWLCSVVKDKDKILQGNDYIDLSDFNTENEEGAQMRGCAEELLKIMGLEKTTISLPELNEFLANYDENSAKDLESSLENLTVATAPYGANSDDAVAAVDAIRDKVADYFLRCKFIQFHDDCAAALDVSVEKVAEISEKNFATSIEEISKYPLSKPRADALLHIKDGINPAWQSQFAKAKELILDVDYPGKDTITEDEWNAAVAKIDAYVAAKDEETKNINEGHEEKLTNEHDVIKPLERLLHLYRDFYTLLRNYVAMVDFYNKDIAATFQAGQLYIDSRRLDLCLKVGPDVAKHMDNSELSDMFLIYCKCTSRVKNETMNIVAVLTSGDINNIRVGKNAVFYDNSGQDWDAVVTHVKENPISVREAFWSPYRKFGRWCKEKFTKSAEEKEAAAFENLTAKADATTAAVAAPGAAPAPAKKPFDIAKFAGIFAAIGIGLGMIIQALTGILGAVFHSVLSAVIFIIIIMLCISGPSMVLAWIKLRGRNLGPVLNANGWAINSKIIVNSRFGRTLTQRAKYPAVVVSKDPYAPMPKWLIWLIFILIVLVVVFLVLYFNNYFDRFGWDCLHYDKANSWIGKIFGAVAEEMAEAGEELNTAVEQAAENAANSAQ